MTFAVSDFRHDYDASEQFAQVTLSTDIPGLNISGSDYTVHYEQDGESVTPIGMGSYDIVATLENDNLNFANQDDSLRELKVGTLEIHKAAYPEAETMFWPAVASLVYGQDLAESVLTGGDQAGKGSFAWKTPETIPTEENGGEVEIRMTVSDSDPVPGSALEKALQGLGNGFREGLTLDLTMNKLRTGADGALLGEQPIHESNPLDEYFTVNEEQSALTIFARQFSLYSVLYTNTVPDNGNPADDDGEEDTLLSEPLAEPSSISTETAAAQETETEAVLSGKPEENEYPDSSQEEPDTGSATEPAVEFPTESHFSVKPFVLTVR